MTDFPELGKTYTSLEDDYDDKASFAMKLILLIVVLVLCVVVALNTLQIGALKQENAQLRTELNQKSKEIKILQNENEKQDSKIRQAITDTDLLYKIINGQDPFYSEKEEDYE